MAPWWLRQRICASGKCLHLVGDYLEDNTEEFKEFVRSTHLCKFHDLVSSLPVQKLL